jgi:hypothetical protein
MRLIKFAFISFFFLALTVTLISLLLPSNVQLSHAIVIDREVRQVYPQISEFKNWSNWEPMFQQAKADISILQSENNLLQCRIQDSGQVINLDMTEKDTSHVSFEMVQNGKLYSINEIDISSVNGNKSTLVVWKVIIKLKWYPWEKFYGIFIDRMTGFQYDLVLSSLKKYIETHPGQ